MRSDSDGALTVTVMKGNEVIPNAPAAVGSYRVIVNTKATKNYLAGNKEFSFEIRKAPLTVTAKDLRIRVKSEIPEYEAIYEGFAGADNAASLGGNLQFTCSYTKESAVGTYEIMPYGLTSENYEFRFVGGTLTVEGSSGGGGGFIPPITVQKPTISTGEGYTVSTGSEGTTATINVQDGYELVDVTVNGVSKGEVTTLTGLKTGDKIEVTVVKKAELSEAEKVQLELAKVTKDNFKARSKQVKMKNGKKAVTITWTNTSGVKFDGVEIFRSLKKNSGYGKNPIYTSKSGKYYNTSVKKGKKYYYKVRSYIEVDGIKYYSAWSAKAWRTVK